MVQIIQMQEPTSAWANFGAGLGQGIAGSAQMMVNQKLNDMLAQKQLARQHSEWFNQGEQIAKFEPDKTKRAMIRDTIAAVGPESYFKMQDRLGIQNMEALMSGSFNATPAAEPPKSPQARQSMVETRDYTPEGLMSSTGQGTGQIQAPPIITQRQPSIQQQELLNAQQTQAQNSQLMANAVAPNIQGIPESQKVQQEQERLQAPVANKNWIRDASEEEFQRALSQVPLGDRQKYRNYRLALQKEQREAASQQETIGLKKRALEGLEGERREKKLGNYRQSMESKRASANEIENSINQARRAIKMGDTESWSQWFASKYNIDPLRSPASQLLDLAKKEFLFGSLSNLSAKAQNQWIEQRFSAMMPTVGASNEGKEVQLAVLEKGMRDVQNEVDLYDKWSDKLGKNPELIPRYVQKDLKKLKIENEDRLSYDLSLIKDKYAISSDLLSEETPIPGEYLTPRRLAAYTKLKGDANTALKFAKKLGYRIPTKEQLLRWTENE